MSHDAAGTAARVVVVCGVHRGGGQAPALHPDGGLDQDRIRLGWNNEDAVLRYGAEAPHAVDRRAWSR
jgi:hypothetical protein